MPQALKDIRFNYHNVTFLFPKRNTLKKFIKHIAKKEGKSIHNIQFIFCNDAYLLEINKTALNHDYYTDIITFDLSESTLIISEIYISIDRVKENAKTYAQSFQNELHRVIFHGILHLCGYKDKTADQTKIIRAKEDYYLKKYFQ